MQRVQTSHTHIHLKHPLFKTCPSTVHTDSVKYQVWESGCFKWAECAHFFLNPKAIQGSKFTSTTSLRCCTYSVSACSISFTTLVLAWSILRTVWLPYCDPWMAWPWPSLTFTGKSSVVSHWFTRSYGWEQNDISANSTIQTHVCLLMVYREICISYKSSPINLYQSEDIRKQFDKRW